MVKDMAEREAHMPRDREDSVSVRNAATRLLMLSDNPAIIADACSVILS
jgi:hypothetical protein